MQDRKLAGSTSLFQMPDRKSNVERNLQNAFSFWRNFHNFDVIFFDCV